MTDLHSSGDATAFPTIPDSASETQPDASGPGEPTSESPAASQAANQVATQELARSLIALREARGLSQTALAAQTKDVEVDSIKGYEKAAYRPQRGALWQLAQALDVMPISMGHSSTRGEAPVPYAQQLLRRGSRALRVQQLAELLGEGRVSLLAVASGLSVEELYALASSESKVTDAQLEPLLRSLPRVQRAWLLSGEGEALGPAQGPAAAAPRIDHVAQQPTAPPAAPTVSLPAPVRAPLTARPAVGPGQASYLPLEGGLVAEVGTVAAGAGLGISHVRLLAGAGEIPVLTGRGQLAALSEHLLALLTLPEDTAEPTL